MVQESQVPQSIMDASQDELPDLTMQIAQGNLPPNLQGYVFIVAPAGTVNSKRLSNTGDSQLNGDGMIYRLNFEQEGEVRVTSRLVRPPDYWADEATQDNELLKFRNHGIVRFSWLLGTRNQLNTAFVPMKFPGESNERLLVTYDAGRPYEIDTETLKLVTPVGATTEWKAETQQPEYPFSLILSTAHPAFDTYTHQMFTVNYGRSLPNLLVIDLINWIKELLEQQTRAPIDEEQEKKRLFLALVIELLLLKIRLSDNFVYLIRWNGVGSLQRWKLVNPDRSPVAIKQSIHQIGVTKDYVVLMDTAFATGIEQVIANFPDIPFVEERNFFRFTPSPDSTLYIVRRNDLQAGQPEVVAQKVTIPCEAAHFLVDYENPDHKITLHIAHVCAWDVAEWLRQSDRSAYDDNPSVPSRLIGMLQGEMDISRMGRYAIDVSSQEPKVSPEIIDYHPCTWGPGLYTYLDRLPSSGMTPSRLDNIYWISFGLWKEVTTEFMYEQYKDYKYRKMPLQRVLELAKEGVPACLYRLHAPSNGRMEIPDYYEFPKGYIVSSPQFVPQRGGEENSTNGYIVCTVFTPERDEIWIFDAGNLKEKPLCKLYHPKLNFGMSLHTAWLQKIGSSQTGYKIPVRQDYQVSVEKLLDLVESLSIFTFTRRDKEELKQEIRNLFEQKVYPHFE